MVLVPSSTLTSVLSAPWVLITVNAIRRCVNHVRPEAVPPERTVPASMTARVSIERKYALWYRVMGCYDSNKGYVRCIGLLVRTYTSNGVGLTSDVYIHLYSLCPIHAYVAVFPSVYDNSQPFIVSPVRFDIPFMTATADANFVQNVRTSVSDRDHFRYKVCKISNLPFFSK